MILIADGGSTKVDWCLADNGKPVKRFLTAGINPFFRSADDINAEIRQNVAPQLEGYKIHTVCFYGAGCTCGENIETVRAALAGSIDASVIKTGSDLLGAAIGLCGNNAGIVCILGTGSNSCYYNGSEITENVSPLGFILGDEGSGAVLGRLFIGACLKNQLSDGIKDKFLAAFQLTPPEILNRVYRQPEPNRFLASIAPFIKTNVTNPSVRSLVCTAFADFFKKNVMQYSYKNSKLFFTGSVAFYFHDILSETAAGMNIRIENIVQSPMEGLIKHCGK